MSVIASEYGLARAENIQALIESQHETAPRHFHLTINAPHVAHHAQAGQFVHILARSNAQYDPLLRRAFSVFRTGGDRFDILYRITGRGTELMSRARAGDVIDIIGPLGRPFAPLGEYSILVGGGVGVPPLAMLAARQNEGEKRKEILALLGARTANDILCRDDFSRSEVPVQVATDDGSAGHHGFVIDLLAGALNSCRSAGKNATVFSCGPLPMLRAVAAMCAEHEVACQVSMEENMPCGIGICNGCVVPVVGASDDYGRYRRICVDGPVAWAHEIDWSHWGGAIGP